MKILNGDIFFIDFDGMGGYVYGKEVVIFVVKTMVDFLGNGEFFVVLVEMINE